MDTQMFFKALQEETAKVSTAFLTWGLGVLIMIIYCFLVAWLQTMFGLIFTILGSLVFLGAAFFVIDLWWSYNRYKHINKMKNLG